MAESERAVTSRFADALRADGTPCRVVAVGSTPACAERTGYDAPLRGCTEIHPGNYVFFDREQADIGACTADDVACSVACAVISQHRGRKQIMIDAGGIALSKDTARFPNERSPSRWGVQPEARTSPEELGGAQRGQRGQREGGGQRTS